MKQEGHQHVFTLVKEWMRPGGKAMMVCHCSDTKVTAFPASLIFDVEDDASEVTEC